jgi:diguanylate cyclase (GGDEF)-like protein
LGVAVFAWRRLLYRPAKLLSALMACVAIWAFASAIEGGVIGISAKVFWSKAAYLGFVFVAPLAFLFILTYIDRWSLIRPLILIFLGGLSVITLLLAWTNEFHGLIWSGFRQGFAGANVLIYDHGPWYWVFISFHYALFTIALILMAGDIRNATAPYKQQMYAIILATLIPAIGGGVYLLNISPIPGLDWSPVSTLFSGIIFAYIIYRYKFLDLVPVARAALVEHMLDGIIVLDDRQRILDINPYARNILPNGQSIQIGSRLPDAVPEFSNYSQKGESASQTLSINLTTERTRYIDVRFSTISEKSAGVNCVLLILRDITKRKTIEIELGKANKQLEERLAEIQKLQTLLQEESIRDPLTNLYNRRYLEDILEREFARANRDQYPVGIVMLDIDHFKKVNDSKGHVFGDFVLQQLSDLLLARFRLEDIICRYGGEEFLIVMPGISMENAYSRVDAFRKELEQTLLDNNGETVQITISGGVAMYPENGETIDSVVSAADRAMYRAKEAGRNQIFCMALPV